MSNKRILGITIFGILLIAGAIGAMLLTSNIRRESAAMQLPDTPIVADRPTGSEMDPLSRVEVNRYTIQAVVSTLSRPVTYSRDVLIESFWQDGHAEFNINVAVHNGVTALRIAPPVGPDKRIIVTTDTLYIWHDGDSTPFVGKHGDTGDPLRTADEWQMLLTFEDIIGLNSADIADAGYTEFGGELCFFALYRSPILGNIRKYYISLDLGLVIAVEEHDSGGTLIYRMTAGDTRDEVDPEMFTLPDGTVVL